MKLSFSTLGSPHYNMGQIIDLAVKSGYDGIEIRAVSGTVEIWKLDEFTGDGLKETAKKVKDAGLEICCVGTSINFSAADKAKQEQALENAKINLEIAKALDCKYIRIFGGPVPHMQGFTETMKWIWEGCGKLCDLTDKTGIVPVLETHDDFSTSGRITDYLSGAPAGKIGVLWDIQHPLRFGEAIKDTYAVLKDLIMHTHIKDSNKYSPSGTDFALTGEGTVPIKECVSLLKSGGYNGYLSFEWEKLWHPEIAEPEVAIPQYAEYMKKLL